MQRHLVRRTVAHYIDQFVCVGIQAVGAAPVVAVAVSMEPDESTLFMISALVSASWGLVLFVLSLVYFLIRDGLRGGSLGKRWAGLEVQPCSMKQSLLRNLVLLALPLVEVVVVLVRKDGRRLGDLLAGTLVARRESAG